MTEIDLSRLPTGEIGWRALVDHVANSDDRVERYFLEVKSDVDLNSKPGRAKVAKFILGAANRDPATAARRFGGHALLMLGVGKGGALGIPGFEAKDLARDVTRLIGADGPRWDFERITGGEGVNDVIVIVVSPPTGDVWTSRADGADGLVNGGIYVRGDGDTRPATGDEVRLMLARAISKPADIDIGVAVEGTVRALQVDNDVLTSWADQRADRYRTSAAPVTNNKCGLMAFSSALSSLEQRSREEFLAEVDAWQEKVLAHPTAGVAKLAASLYPGIRIRLKNRTRTFLRDVRLDIEIDGDVRAVPWLARDDDRPVDLFPDKPIPWGEKHLTPLVGLGARRIQPALRHDSLDGMLQIVQRHPIRLSVALSSLRPEEEHATSDDEVVLLLFAHDIPDGVSGRWRLTAQDVNDVFDGDFQIAVQRDDWRELIDRTLNGDDSPDSVED